MKKVFMVHGFKGEPNGGWRPWLMGELAKQDIYACALPMPNPDAPKKEDWIKTISVAVGNPNEEIFLIGHSLGVPAILRYLETLQSNQKIGGAVLVSGPISKIERNGYSYVNDFLNEPFNFKHIIGVCKNLAVIHGVDDPTVPFKEAEELSKNLCCELIPVQNGKHLNGSAGKYELPQALEILKDFIK